MSEYINIGERMYKKALHSNSARTRQTIFRKCNIASFILCFSDIMSILKYNILI